MLCFLSELLQHPGEAQAEQDTLPFPAERNAAAEDWHIKFLRCCQRENSSIPQTCPPPSMAVRHNHEQAHPESWLQGCCGGHSSALFPLLGTHSSHCDSSQDLQPRRETAEGNAGAELLPMAMLWKGVVVTRWHWESDTVDYPRTISKWLAVIRSRWQWDSGITVIYTEKITKSYMPLATGMDRHYRYAAAMLSMARMVQELW